MVAWLQTSSSPSETGPAHLPNLKWTSVRVDEVIDTGLRLDARFHGSEGREARRVLGKCKWQVVSFGDRFLKDAYYLGRLKRIYADKDAGIPFLLPSQITDIQPKATKYISPKTKIDFEAAKVKKGQVLLTRSGTTGVVSYVSETLQHRTVSDDVIRIETECTPGYIYAYLKSETGRTLLQTNQYGAVVKHVEPHHLEDIPVPDPPRALKKKIHDLIEDSFRLRDESNDLMDEAQHLLQVELKLPDIESLKSRAPKFEASADFSNFSVPLGHLNDRIDGSYHVPIVQTIHEHLNKHARQITTVGDSAITKSIILPNRFKRHYVEEGRGIVFFGGKQLFDLDPENKKYLSVSKHSAQLLDEMRIHTNTILISRSGTIGKVVIAPDHWNEWIPNEHIIRVEPASDSIAGYLYAWLSSEIAHPLITRYTYAAVVDEIDTFQVSQISVPLLHDTLAQQRISDKVLEANSKRTRAYQLEQKALKTLNDEVIYSELQD